MVILTNRLIHWKVTLKQLWSSERIDRYTGKSTYNVLFIQTYRSIHWKVTLKMFCHPKVSIDTLKIQLKNFGHPNLLFDKIEINLTILFLRIFWSINWNVTLKHFNHPNLLMDILESQLKKFRSCEHIDLYTGKST